MGARRSNRLRRQRQQAATPDLSAQTPSCDTLAVSFPNVVMMQAGDIATCPFTQLHGSASHPQLHDSHSFTDPFTQPGPFPQLTGSAQLMAQDAAVIAVNPPMTSSPSEWKHWELARNDELSKTMKDHFKSTTDKDARRYMASRLLGQPESCNTMLVHVAVQQHGSRLIQEFLHEVVGTDQGILLTHLTPHFDVLYQSMHGNHALTKVIELFPSDKLGPLIQSLKGRVATISRHRYGCRVIERFLEHCSKEQLADILDEIVADALALCKHPFGNFVIQKTLEHHPEETRKPIVDRMLPSLPVLAKNRTASYVIQRSLEFCDEITYSVIFGALLNATEPNSLFDIAQNRYGSFVVEQLLQDCNSRTAAAAAEEVRQRLLENEHLLLGSMNGRRLLAICGVELPPEKEVWKECQEDYDR